MIQKISDNLQKHFTTWNKNTKLDKFSHLMQNNQKKNFIATLHHFLLSNTNANLIRILDQFKNNM